MVGTDTPAHRADAGMAWGTLIHGLLEHAMRHKSATRDDLRRLAMWLTVEEPQLRAVIDEALDTVERAARADFWQLAKSREHSVETPFVVSDRGRLTNGVIDLLFQSPKAGRSSTTRRTWRWRTRHINSSLTRIAARCARLGAMSLTQQSSA